MRERLIRSLETCPIVKREEYNYFIHPITDGVPIVEPDLLREVTCELIRVMDLTGVELFVVAEAMGIHLGTALSLMTDIPFTIVRKREYQLPGEVAVHQVTGYSKGQLFLNGIRRGARVAIVDDVISTGGTMRVLLEALAVAGAEVRDICGVIMRGDPDIGRPYQYLVEVEVTNRVQVVS